METVRDTFGRYKVLGPIGAGGMGEVYVARDPQLGRRVAIKMLPLRLTGDRDTLTRFTYEARTASALNHPNIVTIHEVGAEEGSPYIVMEYIEGNDLRSMITSGRPPVRTIVDIASQIADGLAAAHDRGLVHRDLKPENIMVTRDGFAKILDFGLAKMMNPSGQPAGENTLELEMPATNPGTILGTVGYMSPEQARGKPLDFRSDQFAFGAILYELVTGKAAFEEETAVDTLSAILHKTPKPPTTVNPDAPPQLAGIIQRLLEKSPDGRYASTRDLARELRMLRDRIAAEESGFHPKPAPTSRRAVIAAIVAAAALAVFITGALLVSRRNDPSPVAATAPQPTKYLAVLRFKDLTGDPNGQLVVDGFAETLTARLAGFPGLQIMRPATDPTTEDPKKLARDLGANLLLTGSMMRDGDRIRVTYTVVDPSTRREWRDLVEGNISNLFAVQDTVAASVARNLNLGAATARVASLEPAISQRQYLEALGHLRRYDSEQSLDGAIRILEGLGDSASVQAALARAYLYKFRINRAPELAASAGAAAERAAKADPQSIDVQFTLGEVYRHTGRHADAIASFLRALSQQPNHADAVLGLADAYKAAGDLKNAETSYKRAISLQPKFWGSYSKLGAFYASQGRYADAVPQFRKVIELVPDNRRGYNNLGAMYQRLGRYDEAVRAFSKSIQYEPSAQAYSNLGTSYYFAGKYADAARAFEEATRLAPDAFLYWRNLGDAYRWAPGQEAKAREAFERSIALCREAIRVNPEDALAHASMGSALAKIGRDREARAAILRALELEPQEPSHVYEAAVIANIARSEQDAIARLEQAIRLGFNADDIAGDPEFENLRKNGRLREVLTPQNR
jgi:tetratricopeptide (TPR) repeat protein